MIVAVVNRKGGVGKTTTCVNLAAALAKRGKRVLIVDLDPNASAALSMGLNRWQFVPGAADLLLHGKSLAECTRASRVDGIDVVPATVDLSSVESELAGVARGEQRLAKTLRGIHGYDFVMIDSPAGFGLLTRNALAAADGYLVPSVPHFLALEGLDQLFEAVDRLRDRCRSQTRLIGIVVTLADYRAKMTRQSIEALRRRYGRRVFAIEIRVNTSLAEAPAFGQTILDYAPRATGAQAYELLADEFLMRCSGIAEGA